MNERLQKITEKMKRGKPVVGVFVLLADASVSEIIGYSGCDFVWIDSEHGMMDRREIYHHVLAAQSAGACAFVRVPGVDYYSNFPHANPVLLQSRQARAAESIRRQLGAEESAGNWQADGHRTAG